MLNRLALALIVPTATIAVLVVLLLPQGASAAAPTNDNKANASNVIALPFVDHVNNTNATVETDEPENCGFLATVWYKLTAPVTGRVVVNTYGSDFDTGVAVYTAANDLIVCNDDYSGLQSSTAFDAQAGQVYWVQAGGYSGRTGNMVFNIAQASDYAKITGTVRSAVDAMPLHGICVNLYDDTLQRRGFTTTMEDGTYAVEDLLAGDYFIAFTDCSGHIYAGSYYNNATIKTNAQAIHLTTGLVHAGLDVNMPIGGTLSGTVKGSDTGLPIDSICVYATSTDYPFDASAATGADGKYTLTGLNNDYTLLFEPCSSNGPGYVREYYPGVYHQSDATSITVAVGDALTGYDMTLPVGGSISGTVTNGITHQPLDSCVEVYNVTGTSQSYVSSMTVKDDGTYTLGGLPEGQFAVGAYACGVAQFNNVWYDKKASSDTATKLNLTLGQKRTGINFSITPKSVEGDGDCSGGVTISDLIIGLRYLGGVAAGKNCASTLLNVDCNAATNGRDLLVLERYLAGLPMSVPGSCPAIGSLLP